MDKLIDLHTHSTQSDGSMTPTELVIEASRLNLAAVALTDHDTVDGIDQAMAAGRQHDVEVVAGIEFSVDGGVSGVCHLLGLMFDHTHPAIVEPLARIVNSRNERNRNIVDSLNSLGLELTMAEIQVIAAEGQVGRPHIGQALVNRGYVASLQESMDRYIGNGSPAYHRRYKLSMEQAIHAIHRSGGLAILAHPVQLGLAIPALEPTLERFRNVGLDGLEIFYPSQDEGYRQILAAIADRLDLLPTGGSDFHGSYKADISLGFGRGDLRVRYGILEGLRKRVARL